MSKRQNGLHSQRLFLERVNTSPNLLVFFGTYRNDWSPFSQTEKNWGIKLPLWWKNNSSLNIAMCWKLKHSTMKLKTRNIFFSFRTFDNPRTQTWIRSRWFIFSLNIIDSSQINKYQTINITFHVTTYHSALFYSIATALVARTNFHSYHDLTKNWLSTQFCLLET